MEAGGARRHLRLDAQHDSATRRCRATHQFEWCSESRQLAQDCVERMECRASLSSAPDTLPEEVAIDTLTPDQRSRLMSRIRSRDTTPELVVRSMLHRMGYRFRLHRKDLPGKPDVVLPRHRKVVLVHGCFWHGHGCKLGPVPKSNQGYWSPKIAGNRARDARNAVALAELGWQVLELWECQILDLEGTEQRIKEFMLT